VGLSSLFQAKAGVPAHIPRLFISKTKAIQENPRRRCGLWLIRGATCLGLNYQ
jgi:hypothetical protein